YVLGDGCVHASQAGKNETKLEMSTSIIGPFAQGLFRNRKCSSERSLCVRLVALKQVKHPVKRSCRHRRSAIMNDLLRQLVQNRESLGEFSLQHQNPCPSERDEFFWIVPPGHLRQLPLYLAEVAFQI